MTFEQLFPHLRPAVEHLAHAGPGLALKRYFAEFQIVHILSLAVLGGASILLTLRLAGAGLSEEPASEIERNLRPWTTAAIIGVIASGVLMALGNAERLIAYSPSGSAGTGFAWPPFAAALASRSRAPWRMSARA